MIRNILTVDLEEWFVVENLREKIHHDQWDGLPTRIQENTQKILKLFDYYGTRATFFVLGWIAKKFPRLINTVAQSGHEIACHSFFHKRIDQMTREGFINDTEMAVRAIEKACGVTPVGYRAPSWSINAEVPWTFEILADMGFLYDSSIYSIKHDLYGQPYGPQKIFRMNLNNGKSLYEIPASTVRIFGRNFPIGGGGYLRHAPFWFTERMIKKLNKNNQPAVIYIHPWEIDENQPRLKGLTSLQKYRQYGSIATLLKKMELLLEKLDFIPASEYISCLSKRPIGFNR
jgi:polysaccharide deacetylase family protein (PEP-CTERM system associated)